MLKELKRYSISPRREIKEFLTTLGLHELAQAAINIFEPVYLFSLGYSMFQIVLFYLGVYCLYFVVMPFGGKAAKRFGFEHTMSVGILFSIGYFLALIAVPASPVFLYLAIVLYALQKTFWWPGYHANFALYSRSKETGREIGATQVIFSITAAVGPLLGGLLVNYSSFTVLYVVAMGLMLASVIPILSTAEKFKPSTITWREQMRFLFCRAYLRKIIAGFGFGEEIIAYTVWPVFIYLLVGNALNLGALIAGATGLTVLATTIAARWSDSEARRDVFLWGGLLNTLSWIGRPFLIWPLALLGIDTVYRTGKSLQFVPMYANVYDDAKSRHIVLEVVAFEGVLVLGKIVTLALLLVVLPWFGFAGAFALAAVASLFYFLFK